MSSDLLGKHPEYTMMLSLINNFADFPLDVDTSLTREPANDDVKVNPYHQLKLGGDARLPATQHPEQPMKASGMPFGPGFGRIKTSEKNASETERHVSR